MDGAAARHVVIGNSDCVGGFVVVDGTATTRQHA